MNKNAPFIRATLPRVRVKQMQTEVARTNARNRTENTRRAALARKLMDTREHCQVSIPGYN